MDITDFPIKFSYQRLCDQCRKNVNCDATVFEPGKILHTGDCGHCWDINGDPLVIKRWLNDKRKFPSKL